MAVMMTLVSACRWGSHDKKESAPPAVTVGISPSSASVETDHTQQFTATVANATNTSVTWQVDNVTGGSAATGTISTSGLFTAPSAVPSPATVTVKAISVADTSVTASVTVTITAPAAPPPVSVDVQPATASVQTGATQHFTATVSNATDTTVTWSVSGTGCAGAACGTINASGDYTAPGAVPSPATVTVTATSVEDPTKSDTATVTITAPVAGNPLALLDGRFVLTTFDQERNGFVTGVLDFDGAGHVTGGTVDLNVPEATAQTTISNGTYTVGSDGRGRLTVNVTGVGAVHLSFVVVHAGLARIMYFEPTSTGDLFGTLELQTATAKPTGRYVFRLEGTGLTGRRGYVGVMDLGALTAELDFTEPNPTGFQDGYGTSQVFSGDATLTVGAADANGRGALSLSGARTGTLQFAYWVISATRIALIPMDPVAPIIAGTAGASPASGGVAEKQGTMTAGAIAAGSYVYTAMGFDSAGVFDKGGRIVSAGGATSPAVSDEVGAAGGQLLDVATNCDTTMSATGRADIFCTPGSYGVRTFFIDANHAFSLMYAVDRFGVGELYKQSAASYTTANVAGEYAFLAFGDETANNIAGALNATDTGGLTGTEDITEDGVQEPDVTVTGTYTLNAAGTGETNVTAASVNNQQRFWVVSPDRVIGFTINDSDKESLVLDRQDLTVP
jgi:hypothetical protein